MSEDSEECGDTDGASRAKRLAQNLALMAFTGLLCFLVLEVGLRVAYGDPPKFLSPQVKHIPMPYGYKLEPDQRGSYTLDKPVRTNGQGFRDDEWDTPKPEGSRRIMLIGDSFTFGNNARQEDTFGARLEVLLAARSGGSVRTDVLVAGVGGWNVDNYAEFFVTEGVEYEPDAVVVAFFENDFQSPGAAIRVPEFDDSGRYPSRPKWLKWLSWDWIFLLKRSALVVYVRDRTALLGEDPNGWHPRLMRNEVDLDTDPRVQNTYDELQRINDAARELGIPMGIAVLPAVNTFWGEPNGWGFIDHLKAFGETEGIAVVNLADGFWQEEDTDSFFSYPWDNHYNANGHRLVAEQLAPFVTQMLTPASLGGRTRPDRAPGGR